MRIFEIALFIILFNAALGFVTSIPMFGGTSIQYNSTLSQVIPNATEAVEMFNPGPPYADVNSTDSGIFAVLSWWVFQAWQWVSAILRPAQILINILSATFNIGFYLKSLIPWIPDGLAVLLTTGVDTLYVIGLVQFFSGRNFKTMR